MAADQLNIIFHGPFIFVLYSDHIDVLSPIIEEHEFRAGNLHLDAQCDPGTYTLKGVTARQKPLQGLNDQTFVILNAANFPNMQVPTNADYLFKLSPLPSRIMPLGLLTPQPPRSRPPIFTGDDEPKINVPPQMGSAHLITYLMNPTDEPQLDDFDWTPQVKQVGNLNVANLHIYSESPLIFDLDDSHAATEFDEFKRELLPGLSLEVVDPFPAIQFDLNTDAITQGIDDEEQGGLRGLPLGKHTELYPPRICDSPSMVVINATDTVP